jgi:hypothetical protein
MKQRYLLPLLLLVPFLAHADALSARGEGLFIFALLMLGVTILVVIGFLIVIYSWPRWSGVPYALGLPLLLLTLVRLQVEYPSEVLNLVWLLALLPNGLVWAREFRPKPMRVAGRVAIAIGSAGMGLVISR